MAQSAQREFDIRLLSYRLRFLLLADLLILPICYVSRRWHHVPSGLLPMCNL